MRHVTWRRLVLAGNLAAIAGGGCNRKDAHRQASLQPPPKPVSGLCGKWQRDNLTQSEKSLNPAREECTPDQCGLNGMWFGQGVPFRELHLNGEPNTQGLKLVEVIPPHSLGAGKKPVLAIRPALGHPNHDASPGTGTVSGLPAIGDELFLKDEQSGKTLLDGTEMKGVVLVIGVAGSSTSSTPRANVFGVSFRLKIMNVLERSFWDCDVKDKNKDCRLFEYEFYATTDADGGCEVQVCDPALAQNKDIADNPIQGTAVVFAGDVYEDEGFKVRSTSAKCPGDVLDQEDEDIINFACIGTVVSKLHLMRHTAASERSTKPTTVSQRQAMLRMLTADYCGIGYSFTHDRTPIQFRTMSWPDFHGYELDENQPLEAVWTDRGASCLGTPRRDTYDKDEEIAKIAKIAAKCQLPGCPVRNPDMKLLTPPSPPSPELTCFDASGNYLMSAIPPPEQPPERPQ